MKRLNFLWIAVLGLSLLFVGCEKDEDITPTAPTQNNNGGGSGSGSGSGGGTVAKNSLTNDSTIALTEYTSARLMTGNGNLGYQLDFWAQYGSISSAYWIIGLHHIPTVDTTYESSFSYHWQNIPDGKFYFSRLKDGKGDSWWYTKSETITMEVKVEGDNITFTCVNIAVGNHFLPSSVTENTTVSASVTAKISDITSVTNINQGSVRFQLVP